MPEHDQIDDDQTQNDDDNIAQLREAAERGRKAVQEKAELERRLAFAEAGIPTSSALGQMFTKAYDGELTAEAIKAAAAEIGLNETPVQQVDDTVSSTNERIREALSDGPAGTATGDDRGPDPMSTALTTFQQERAQIGDENARLGAFDRMIVAAASGDDRAIFDDQQFMEQARAYGHGAEI